MMYEWVKCVTNAGRAQDNFILPALPGDRINHYGASETIIIHARHT